MSDIRIIIATTKKYRMPEDEVYLPLHVGAALRGKGDLDYTTDATGDNISDKNASYCELTGLYWAWKNLDCDVLGMVHYRRYFASPDRERLKNAQTPFDRILTGREVSSLMKRYSLILPTKRHYVIETLQSHYAHTHYEEQLLSTRVIIERMYPEYLACFDRVMKKTSGHMFNMLIARRDILGRYCSWLFPILEELEDFMSVEELSSYQERYIGRIAELIFNVWLEYELEKKTIKRSDILELPVVYAERVDWIKKGRAFLLAKFFHKKYEKSF